MRAWTSRFENFSTLLRNLATLSLTSSLSWTPPPAAVKPSAWNRRVSFLCKLCDVFRSASRRPIAECLNGWPEDSTWCKLLFCETGLHAALWICNGYFGSLLSPYIDQRFSTLFVPRPIIETHWNPTTPIWNSNKPNSCTHKLSTHDHYPKMVHGSSEGWEPRLKSTYWTMNGIKGKSGLLSVLQL